MSLRVRITASASIDMEDAAAWWAEHHSLEQALRWLREIHEHIASFAAAPDRCPLAREAQRLGFDLRESPFGVGRRLTHRVLFRILGAEVEVLAVRHVAQRPLRPGDFESPPA